MTRLIIVIVGAALSVALGIAGGSILLGLIGPVPPLVAMGVVSACMSLHLLVLTAVLFRRDRESIAALGLQLTRPRLREFLFGFSLSAALFMAVVWVQSRAVGASWTFQGAAAMPAAFAGLILVACAVLAEELLFRGAALKYLRAAIGDRGAIVVSAACFGAYHLVGSHNWGMGAVFTFVMPALGGLLFGWAAVRSRGLALPIGLHLGGNWVQASVAVFAPFAATPATPVRELWRIPITAADASALAAPDLLPRLPYMLAVALAAVLTWRLCKGAGTGRTVDFGRA